MQARKRRFGGHGFAVGHRFKKAQQQVCQRCARAFSSTRLVPYCPSCYREKRAEHRAWANGSSAAQPGPPRNRGKAAGVDGLTAPRQRDTA